MKLICLGLCWLTVAANAQVQPLSEPGTLAKPGGNALVGKGASAFGRTIPASAEEQLLDAQKKGLPRGVLSLSRGVPTAPKYVVLGASPEQQELNTLASHAKNLSLVPGAQGNAAATLNQLIDTIKVSTATLREYQGRPGTKAEDQDLIEIMMKSARSEAALALNSLKSQADGSQPVSMNGVAEITASAERAATRVAGGALPFPPLTVVVRVANQNPLQPLKVYGIPEGMVRHPEAFDDRIETSLARFSFSQSPSPAKQVLPGDARIVVWVGPDFADAQMAKLIRARKVTKTKLVMTQQGEALQQIEFSAPAGITMLTGDGK